MLIKGKGFALPRTNSDSGIRFTNRSTSEPIPHKADVDS